MTFCAGVHIFCAMPPLPSQWPMPPDLKSATEVLKATASPSACSGNPHLAHADYTALIEHSPSRKAVSEAYCNRAFCYGMHLFIHIGLHLSEGINHNPKVEPVSTHGRSISLCQTKQLHLTNPIPVLNSAMLPSNRLERTFAGFFSAISDLPPCFHLRKKYS